MASSKAYLDFVLEQLAALEGVSARAMMGEYLLYYRGKVVGGVYDDRFLLKPTVSARALMPDATEEIPYPGAKPMLAADVDDAAQCCRVIEAIAEELSAPKGKKA